MSDHRHESYEVYGLDGTRQDAREALALAGGLREDLAAAENRIHELESQLRRDASRDVAQTDSLAEHLEYRVAALEEIEAARWPRRILVRARLGRQLRASVRNVQGDTFADRRAEAAGLDWLERP